MDEGRDQRGIGSGPSGALRLPGGTRRVDHGGARALLWRRVWLVVAAERQHPVPRAEAVSLAPEHHDLPQLVEPALERGHLGGLLCVGHDESCIAVVDHVRHLFGHEAVGQRYRHQPELAGGVDEHENLAAVRPAPDRDVAGRKAETHQPVRQPVDLAVEVGVRRRRVALDDRVTIGRRLGVEGQRVLPGHGHPVTLENRRARQGSRAARKNARTCSRRWTSARRASGSWPTSASRNDRSLKYESNAP